MKKLIKIISNIPCCLKANNQLFFVKDCLFLEVIDEETVFFTATPLEECEYYPINYTLSNKLTTNKNVRATKYKNNIKLEFFFSSANKIKTFTCDDFFITYYNNYYLVDNNQYFLLDNFKQNYYKLSTLKLNENFYLIKGFYKLCENKSNNRLNQKISIAIYDKVNKKIVHKDNCHKVEYEKNLLKLTSLMFDQNKQALSSEFLVSDNQLTKNDFYSSYTKQRPETLNKKYQIGKAFFECILSNNKNLLATYLTDDLKGKIKDQNLHLMFNNFIKVDNEFLTNLDEINLLTHHSDNIYEATTYKIEFINGKISNIVSI
ncbi:MAG: hypothetical protein IJW82_03395 [Clostridia bacterium]|nr:hypothetical protein [Clostridia bacterium]